MKAMDRLNQYGYAPSSVKPSTAIRAGAGSFRLVLKNLDLRGKISHNEEEGVFPEWHFLHELREYEKRESPETDISLWALYSSDGFMLLYVYAGAAIPEETISTATHRLQLGVNFSANLFHRTAYTDRSTARGHGLPSLIVLARPSDALVQW
jgi:hypothetical protein